MARITQKLGASDDEAASAYDMMDGTWSESEFERHLQVIKLRDWMSSSLAVWKRSSLSAISRSSSSATAIPSLMGLSRRWGARPTMPVRNGFARLKAQA